MTEGGWTKERRASVDALVERLDREKAALENVLESLPAVLSSRDPVTLVKGILRLASEVSCAELAAYVPGGDRSDLGAGAVFVGEPVEERPQPREAPLLSAAFVADHPLRIDDVTRWAPSDTAQRPYGSLAGGRLLRSWVAAPVRTVDGTAFGAIFVGHSGVRVFDARIERLVGALSLQLAVALEKASLLEERDKVAVALQENLLPPLLPAIEGIDVGARYRATGEGNLVGGDFYDVFAVGSGEWAVVLGDVSGFGPEAAALTGLARYTIRAVARSERSPAAVLTLLNEAMRNQRSDERFCTAVQLLVGLPGSGQTGGVPIVVARGGHPPALVLRDDGHVDAIEEEPGTLLGLFPEARVQDVDVELHPGDAIVLYTDGVTEARDSTGDMFGQERLEALLSSCAGRTADGIARRIELAVIDHQHGETHDDVAVVVVRAPTV